MNRQYELMIILRPDFSGEEKAARDMVSKLVGGRKIDSVTVMGKKPLAYAIKKQKEGVYVLATVSGEPIKVEVLEQQMKLGTDVLRYLLIVKS